MVDYAKVLQAYIDHVFWIARTDYLRGYSGGPLSRLTESEKAALIEAATVQRPVPTPEDNRCVTMERDLYRDGEPPKPFGL
jgi:hypothetical protein